MDEVRCCLEVDTHVKLNRVSSLYAHVGDLQVLIDSWLSFAVTVRCIQDVSDSMQRQISSVLCTMSEKHNSSEFPDEPFACSLFHSDGLIFG